MSTIFFIAMIGWGIAQIIKAIDDLFVVERTSKLNINDIILAVCFIVALTLEYLRDNGYIAGSLADSVVSVAQICFIDLMIYFLLMGVFAFIYKTKSIIGECIGIEPVDSKIFGRNYNLKFKYTCEGEECTGTLSKFSRDDMGGELMTEGDIMPLYIRKDKKDVLYWYKYPRITIVILLAFFYATFLLFLL